MNHTNQLSQLDILDKRWAMFVESFAQANIFHHPDWANILSACYGYQPFIITIEDEKGDICAGLPFIDVKSPLTGRRWVSLPFTDYCLPLHSDQIALSLLTEEIIGLSAQTRIEVRWELPPDPAIQSSSQFVWHTLNLNQDIESISKLLHRTQRQNIKTAEKNGVHIMRGNDLDHMHEFYRLHCLTRRRQGVPVQPWRFFELMLEKLVMKGMGFILLAYQGNRCLAAGLFLHWHKTLTYKYAASDDFGQDLRPNHLITWTAIRWGCENGYSVFDFGRTDRMNEGLKTFKTRWGAEENSLSYSVFSKKFPQAKNNGKTASLMNTVIKKSPPWVCRLTGELLYRHFG